MENQAKIANLILKKYEEIGKILAGMIFKCPPSQFPKLVTSRSSRRKTWKIWLEKVAKIWIVMNNAPF